MKYSTKVSDAVHILAFIVLNPRGSLSSDSIAESLHTNPGCVRQLMSAPSAQCQRASKAVFEQSSLCHHPAGRL